MPVFGYSHTKTELIGHSARSPRDMVFSVAKPLGKSANSSA